MVLESRVVLCSRVVVEFCGGVIKVPFDMPESSGMPPSGDGEPVPVKVWERRLALSIAERKRLRNHVPGKIHGRRDEAY